jgi:hypothetical protein
MYIHPMSNAGNSGAFLLGSTLSLGTIVLRAGTENQGKEKVKLISSLGKGALLECSRVGNLCFSIRLVTLTSTRERKT